MSDGHDLGIVVRAAFRHGSNECHTRQVSFLCKHLFHSSQKSGLQSESQEGGARDGEST